jgi:anaerobic dimethyl sulfoxide reductase subunit C (anchor subunit)
MSEGSLTVFTIAIQLACGLAVALTFCERHGGAANHPGLRRLGMAVFPMAALGLAFSFFHLGRPLAAYLALSNLPASWLSLEILSCLLFLTAAFAYSRMWGVRREQGRFVTGFVASLLGIAAVGTSSAVYMLPALPAWNSAWIPVSFAGTALMLGALAPPALADLSGEPRLRKALAAFGLAGALGVLSSMVWMISWLSQTAGDEFLAAQLQEASVAVLSRHAPWLGAYFLLAAILPVVLASRLWADAGSPAPAGDAAGSAPSHRHGLIYAAVLIGAVIGRFLMYTLGAARRPF